MPGIIRRNSSPPRVLITRCNRVEGGGAANEGFPKKGEFREGSSTSKDPGKDCEKVVLRGL